MSVDALQRALGGSERILLDSSALIAYHNPHEVTHPLVEHLMGRVENHDDSLRASISAISVTELLIRPIRTGQAEFTFMHSFLTSFPNLTVLPMDTVVAVQAATLRASMGLALPDAVVVASGLLAGCDAIVSSDARWKLRGAARFPQFRWIYLRDYS